MVFEEFTHLFARVVDDYCALSDTDRVRVLRTEAPDLHVTPPHLCPFQEYIHAQHVTGSCLRFDRPFPTGYGPNSLFTFRWYWGPAARHRGIDRSIHGPQVGR